jgi:metal-sulfur cluster biosynthetic enzyme
MSDAQDAALQDVLQHIWDALREVYDPEIPLSVVDLGMVRQIKKLDGEIEITMIPTTPFCPMADMILEQARAAAQAVTGQTVLVKRGTELWDRSMITSPGQP